MRKTSGLLFNDNNEKLTHNSKFLEYLTLIIFLFKEEIDTNHNGTNTTLNSTSAIFVIDTTLFRSFNNGTLNYNSDGTDITVYSENNLLGKGESNLQNTTNENLIFKNIFYKKNFLILILQ